MYMNNLIRIDQRQGRNSTSSLLVERAAIDPSDWFCIGGLNPISYKVNFWEQPCSVYAFL